MVLKDENPDRVLEGLTDPDGLIPGPSNQGNPGLLLHGLHLVPQSQDPRVFGNNDRHLSWLLEPSTGSDH
jgi:hypothetical protein